jgi:hypothetical protein
MPEKLVGFSQIYLWYVKILVDVSNQFSMPQGQANSLWTTATTKRAIHKARGHRHLYAPLP